MSEDTERRKPAWSEWKEQEVREQRAQKPAFSKVWLETRRRIQRVEEGGNWVQEALLKRLIFTTTYFSDDSIYNVHSFRNAIVGRAGNPNSSAVSLRLTSEEFLMKRI